MVGGWVGWWVGGRGGDKKKNRTQGGVAEKSRTVEKLAIHTDPSNPNINTILPNIVLHGLLKDLDI